MTFRNFIACLYRVPFIACGRIRRGMDENRAEA